VAYRVILTEPAIEDLALLSDYLAEVAGEDVAETHDAGIKAICYSLTDFPRRGRPRDELRPGLRSIPFARLVTIFYTIDKDEVQIVRVMNARRDVNAAFQ
jgi:toxin ParE1/3/4